jgi:YD repeat-containing protein
LILDLNGLPQSTRSKTGVRTDYAYDALGRQISARVDAASSPRSVGSFTHYNSLGQPDWVEVSKGQTICRGHGIAVLSPVGLDEHAVDLLDVNGAGLRAHGFDECGQAEVAGAAQEAFGSAHHEGEGVLREGVVSESGVVELLEDERLDGFRSQAWHHHGVGDARADLFVDRQAEGLQQRRLSDEHEVVRAGEVFEEQAQLAQAVGLHQVGVIDGF